jgi:PPOX class probable F420-dependent enzyme
MPFLLVDNGAVSMRVRTLNWQSWEKACEQLNRKSSAAPQYAPVMTSDSTTTRGEQRFVSLTTFKRNGEGVSAPMWIGRDGADLFVWTPADSWKVKRVGNNPRVLLAPSSRFGKVRDGALPIEGTAQVVTDPTTVDRLQGEIRRKYGLGHRLVTFVEKIAARGHKSRVIVRIAVSG